VPGEPPADPLRERASGGRYTARVTRRDGNATLHGSPRYAGPAAGDAARSSASDEAIAPLLELATSLRAGAQAAYAIRKLHGA
jgi:hypothetical protein